MRERFKPIEDRYGRLTIPHKNDFIIHTFPNGKSIRKYKCICDCGNTLYVSRQGLKDGHTKSCGCFRQEKRFLGNGISGLNALFTSYKGSAKRRNLSFLLTLEEFKNLTNSNCYYCNQVPENKSFNRDNTEAYKRKGTYTYNGIDRIDNKKGYNNDNVITCCIQCNKAKNVLGFEEFKNWISKIYFNMKGKDNV